MKAEVMYPYWEVEAERPAKNAGRTSRLMSEGLRLRNRSGWGDQRRTPPEFRVRRGIGLEGDPYSDPRLSPRACMGGRQPSLRRDPQRTCSQRQTIAKLVIYRAFIESESSVPRTLARDVHRNYFEPCTRSSLHAQCGLSATRSHRR